ncbi:LysE family translocator [Roseibium algae]|uniref:LysE family translocator n=1 Tax=Roseibium algae TaxID=3123038 RepID=A0ABU8TGU8_9HYPH
MTIETWAAFAIASLILTMTPGPSILLGVVHALKFGVRRTTFTALGDITANMLQMLIVAIGLGVVIAHSPMTFQAIKWSGVATLAYMSAKMMFGRQAPVEMTEQGLNVSRAQLYSEGFMVAFCNPKALVFFTAFFPQFLDPAEPIWSQLALMCPTMAILDFTLVMTYALTANQFLGFLRRHPNVLNRAGGTALLGAAGYLSLA